MREDFGTHSSRVPLAGDSPLYSRISSDVLCDQMVKLGAAKCIVSSSSKHKETGALLGRFVPNRVLGSCFKTRHSDCSDLKRSQNRDGVVSST